MKAKIFVVLLLVFFVAVPCYAASYYVSQSTGNDSTGVGSQGNPWKTLTYTYSQISTGDTIYLKRGDTWTDTDELVGNREWIKLTKNITIDAYGTGDRPILSRFSETGGIREIVYGSSSYLLTINNIYLRAARSNYALYGIRILSNNCKFDGNGYAGEGLIRTSASNSLIQNCTVDLANGADRYDKFVEFGAVGSNASDNTVRDCSIEGIAGTGSVRFLYQSSGTNTVERVHFWGNISKQNSYGTAWAITVRNQTGTKTIVRNNIFDLTASNTLSGCALAAYAVWNGGGTLKFHNNTIVGDNDGCAIHSGGSGYTYYAYNNIIYDLSTGFNNAGTSAYMYNNAFHSTPTEIDGDSNETEVGNLSNQSAAQIKLVDPKIPGSNAEDVRLQSGSVCINAGANGETDLPTDDYSSDNRDGSQDIGAFEFKSTSSISTPQKPQNLRIVSMN